MNVCSEIFFFQGRYCSVECQREDWEQHRDFCNERAERRRERKGEKSKKEGGGDGDGGGEGDGGGGGDRGGEGGGERQSKEEETGEVERCRVKMKAMAFSEVD